MFAFSPATALTFVLTLVLAPYVGAAESVRLPVGQERELVIDTDDPHVDIVLKGERSVRLVDSKSGKSYQFDRIDLTLSFTDDPDGLSLTIGERPILLKRQGKLLASLWLEARRRRPDEPAAKKWQVQVETTMARVKKQDLLEVLPEHVYREQGAIHWPLRDRAAVAGVLKALVETRKAKIISEPRITTLSGREAVLLSGGEVPVLTTTGTAVRQVSYKAIGTVIKMLPVVLANGRIRLDVHPEITSISPGEKATLPASAPIPLARFRTSSARLSMEVDNHQTLAIVLARSDATPATSDDKAADEAILILMTPHATEVAAAPQ